MLFNRKRSPFFWVGEEGRDIIDGTFFEFYQILSVSVCMLCSVLSGTK